MKYDIVILGGGVAGMRAAISAKELNLSCVIIEKSNILGGHVIGLNHLFPEDYSASEFLERMRSEVAKNNIEVKYNREVVAIDSMNHTVTTSSSERFSGKTIIIATGYVLFNASLKQEYGYGIFENVVTSYEFEQMIKNENLLTASGNAPRRIAFLHCVGSRDEKVLQNHCSKVCCVTAVRQAINVRQRLPQCKTYCFYMDIRMFGAGYEEMYRTAQQDYQIHFIRGRVSEAAPTIDGEIALKAEDTLIGKPIRLSVDMLVLMIGMCSNPKISEIAEKANLDRFKSGFLKPINSVDFATYSNVEGIFYAGTASAPKNIQESINDASMAVFAAANYIKNSEL